MKPKITVCFTAGLLLLLIRVSYAQDGQLDTSFASNGIATNSIGSTNGLGWSSEAHSTVIQSDGKIVVAGTSRDADHSFFTVVRYDTDGSIDSTFGTNGIDTTDIGWTDDKAYSAVIQGDGKIVAAGYSSAAGERVFALVRYNTDGSLDSSFGSNGIVKTGVGQSDDEIYSVAVQGDGKIVAVGTSSQVISNQNLYVFALVRYNPDGSLDNTFGTNGIVSIYLEISNNPLIDNKAKSVIIQTDGKIVVGGYSGNPGLYQYISQSYFALLRFNTDGSLDNSFGANGIVLTSIGVWDDEVSSLAIQSDRKIVAAGNTDSVAANGTAYEYFFALARYNSDGSLDGTFGKNGKVITAIGQSDDASTVALQRDGKIVAVGYSLGKGIALARYNNEGSLDSTFGADGIVTTTGIGWGGDRAYSAAIQSDGKIVVAGAAEYNNFYNFDEFVVARYANNSGGASAVSESAGLPKSFVLYQNYPNPFNPTTMISYQLPMSSHVTLKVYDVLGREVAALVSERENAGSYSVTFYASGGDGSRLSSGVYFYRLTAGSYVATKKLVIVK